MSTLVDLALIAALAAARRVLNSEVAAVISDKMDAEGRKFPNADEQAQLDAITKPADAALDEAIERAEAEGR